MERLDGAAGGPVTRTEVRIEHAPTRCPYCHEAAEVEGTVACEVCLARHHAGCWDDHGRCSACDGEGRLEPARAARPSHRPVARTLIDGAAALGVLGVAVWAGAVVASGSVKDARAFTVIPFLASLALGAATGRREAVLAASLLPSVVFALAWFIQQGPSTTQVVVLVGTVALLALPGLLALWLLRKLGLIRPARPASGKD